jgi:hypothetical protein
VINLIRPENRVLYQLAFVDGNGQQETFSVTDDHPWKVQGKGWVETQHLVPSDRIDTASGEDLVVKSVNVSERSARTYNLTVADWHTFMVGRNETIVHNQNCFTHNYKYARIFADGALRIRRHTTSLIPSTTRFSANRQWCRRMDRGSTGYRDI